MIKDDAEFNKKLEDLGCDGVDHFVPIILVLLMFYHKRLKFWKKKSFVTDLNFFYQFIIFVKIKFQFQPSYFRRTAKNLTKWSKCKSRRLLPLIAMRIYQILCIVKIRVYKLAIF